jgi:hypothetical protein
MTKNQSMIIQRQDGKYFLVGESAIELKAIVPVEAFREALKIDPNLDKTKWSDKNCQTQKVMFSIL